MEMFGDVQLPVTKIDTVMEGVAKMVMKSKRTMKMMISEGVYDDEL